MQPTIQYIVGTRRDKQTDHVIVDAEDALVAALKVKLSQTDATITYVRRVNKRGDARHQPQQLARRRGG